MAEERTKLVYSTDRSIPRKERSGGQSPVPASGPSGQKAPQKVIVRLDRKRRGGKTVTVIEGLLMPAKDREALLRSLKAGLGTGGTVKDSALEIQGDHCDAVIALLTNIGFRPKRSGS
jgi:translation initiation factor 1